MMLHEAQPICDAASLGAFDTGDAADGAMLASIGSACSPTRSSTPGHRQQHQQRVLRQSICSSGSYVAAVRGSSALPIVQSSIGSDKVSPRRPAATAAGTATPPQLPFGPVAAAGAAGWGDHGHLLHQRQSEEPPLTPAGEDFVHEILAMNTLAMEQCYAALAATDGAAAGVGAAVATSNPNATATSEEPMRILGEAYMRVDETSAQGLPGPLLDELKTTTLNNMGVVECNRGQPRQALSHFEAARQLEENNGISSPSIALNMCAAYNALRMFDKATAAALEAIDMLRSLELQRRRNHRLTATTAAPLDGSGRPWSCCGGATHRSAKDGDASTTDLLLEAAAAPKIADSQNDALWGAAWNNLAVAQINTARGSTDTSEYTNTLSLFQNAMRATQELLGMQHPMSKAVIATFRSVRRALRNHGAFKQHHSLLRAPLPPVDPREQEWEEAQVESIPGRTRHGTLQQQRQQLTVTFRGEVTGGQKMVERLDSTPYPGAVAQPYQRQQRMRSASSGRATTTAATSSRNRSRSGNRRQPRPQAGTSQLLRSMPLSRTLSHASAVYGNPHPLLYSPPPPGQYMESTPPSFSASARMAATQYDGPAAAAGGAISFAGSGRQSRDRDQHIRTNSSRDAGMVRTPPPPRQQQQQQPATVVAARGGGRRGKLATAGSHFSQTAPNPSCTSGYAQNNAASAAAVSPPPQPTRPPVSKVLPPLGIPSYTGGAAAPVTSFAERNEVRAATAGAVPFEYTNAAFSDTSSSATASLFMHHPPQRPSQAARAAPNRSMPTTTSVGAYSGASGAEHMHQSKLLLLATPSTGVASTSYYPLEVASAPVVNAAEDHGPASMPLTAPSTVPEDGDPSEGAHELFRGMWVTVDPHYVHRGPRVFGRPAYYIATTLDVTEDGKGGSVSVTGAGTSSAVSPTQTDSGTHPALPTLTYSSSGSEGESGVEGERRAPHEPVVHHRSSASTDARSPSVPSLANTLEETSRMTK
ncbi:hypothetical protein GH5_08085 [Leishmania sp. Ghana 2012 LV757]|uniref:hypothetical protein n=1 Tax=Leishmania sp. Ghana 2012 LV757 TaxID=2803181 RepID=UPI001B6A0A37|nr:hypothetical protein GH5_08085 [Leishmania sp. Ghana 2012 LV757]